MPAPQPVVFLYLHNKREHSRAGKARTDRILKKIEYVDSLNDSLEQQPVFCVAYIGNRLEGQLATRARPLRRLDCIAKIAFPISSPFVDE